MDCNGGDQTHESAPQALVDKLDTAAIAKRRNTVSVHNKRSFSS
jgi:hypothetical protein